MEKLKIKISNEDDKQEAIDLLVELGYTNGKYTNDRFLCLFAHNNGCIQSVVDDSMSNEKHRAVSLPELRAIVSLHKNPINMDKVLSEVRSDALGLLEDKEYLNKETHAYVKTHDLVSKDSNWIEIPEGADYYAKDSNNGFNGEFFFRLRSDGFDYEAVYLEGKWMNAAFSVDGQEVLWQRHTQPEELPFVGDESSLNDQYAEIEQVRQEYKIKNDMSVDDYINSLRSVEHRPNQTTINAMNEADTLFSDAESSKHNHYFIDVSDVDEVDFYEIALRYNVTDPCIQHILKKCLAAGNRGHKDFHTDLKDIYDTAARALRIHGG